MRKLRDWLHEHATAIGAGAAVVTVLLTAVAFVFGWGALNPFAEAPATVVQGYSIEQPSSTRRRSPGARRRSGPTSSRRMTRASRCGAASLPRSSARGPIPTPPSARGPRNSTGSARNSRGRGAPASRARIEAAQAALSNGDTELADRIFAEVEKMEQGSIERAADAAYQRGLIAEDEVRWADAADHFARAARLAPDFDRLLKAREFAWRAGEYGPARALGPDLIAAAIAEHGEGSAEHATALNGHALTLYTMGRYRQAEPLYRQAMEITGEALGTEHPDYAIRLNNLAELLAKTERAGEALKLYARALGVVRAALGAAHPHTRLVAGNYARLLRGQVPDDPALGALEAEFGAGIGREG